jgi:hypothetical protein
VNFLSPGAVTGYLSCLALVATAFGKGELAKYFNDPETAQQVLILVGAGGTFAAGVMKGVKAVKDALSAKPKA